MLWKSRYQQVLFVLACCWTVADASDSLPLLELSSDRTGQRRVVSSDQVSFQTNEEAGSVDVKIAVGDAGYPGIAFKPTGESWDLSAFGHVEARITNTCQRAFSVNLRVDNAGDWRKEPWNTESVYVKPGETATGKVIFGYQYGLKPGFKLNTAKVVQVMLFTGKVGEPISFRIESLIATGPAGEKPPVKPENVRIQPVDGYVLGGDVKLDASKQLDPRDGATARVVNRAGQRMLGLILPANQQNHEVYLRPPMGRWDFTRACEVRMQVSNAGQVPITPGMQVTSDRYHGTDIVRAEGALPPGKSCELVVLFEASNVWQGPEGEVTKAHATGVKGTGTRFDSDKADAIKIFAEHDGEAALLVESIRALATPVQTPSWLGKRPPVEGDWSLTFADEFEGDKIDRDRWNIYTENYWDKRSHFSQDNVILGNGVVRLHMEKNTGHENDDPHRKETDYAVGFLDTYGKWAQRYGYFEARMKLPTAPGLWPAFWMMPDRGPKNAPQWKRADTGNGGMEYDIMEHLTAWGPYRYNVAMHWDGYQKDHKSIGSSQIYTQPDEEGFITCGLLWTPGSASYYCNGKVVAQWRNDRISAVPSYPILYMVTGGWANSPLADDQLPADFVIDYVRIWQRKDLASPVDEKIR